MLQREFCWHFTTFQEQNQLFSTFFIFNFKKFPLIRPSDRDTRHFLNLTWHFMMLLTIVALLISTSSSCLNWARRKYFFSLETFLHHVQFGVNQAAKWGHRRAWVGEVWLLRFVLCSDRQLIDKNLSNELWNYSKFAEPSKKMSRCSLPKTKHMCVRLTSSSVTFNH